MSDIVYVLFHQLLHQSCSAHGLIWKRY